MVVYKFGGASIATPEKMAHLVPILRDATQPLIIVVSALGKTTNALEDIVNMAISNRIGESVALMKKLEKIHLLYAKELLNSEYENVVCKLIAHQFEFIEEKIFMAKTMPHNFIYDQVVCMGEILSTLIFSFFMRQNGIDNEWLDIRNMLRTDANYRDAAVLWHVSEMNVRKEMTKYIEAGTSIVTQGFIGASMDGYAVTLGREGSDYTAALLAAMLAAESLTIWKDVPGLMNADPKQYKNPVKIEAISYNEILEMSYYGAQIIHPKTIKPLQNANIPLYVKCFANRHLPGTVINDSGTVEPLPPLIVYKYNQILLQVTTRDFSFITEDNLSKIYGVFHYMKIRVNVIQNAALSFVACIDFQKEKLTDLLTTLSMDYKVLSNEDVTLLTIRYHTPEIIEELTEGKTILLKQETRKTLQVVMV